ncbi:hypothetical protein EON81_19450 [bacterium]|nr:MAG: hypothetical protein EON81_19450 [bacterium]
MARSRTGKVDHLPGFVEAERDALLADIEAAFAGVGREGGISWSEAEVLDMYGTAEDQAKARAQDREPGWRSLVDDSKWRTGCGVGGWSFLDAVGFRYYLPAAMIRCIRTGNDEGIEYHLRLDDDKFRDFRADKWSLLTLDQRRCVRRFLEYMGVVTAYVYGGFDASGWQQSLELYWDQIPMEEVAIPKKEKGKGHRPKKERHGP